MLTSVRTGSPGRNDKSYQRLLVSDTLFIFAYTRDVWAVTVSVYSLQSACEYDSPDPFCIALNTM